MNERQTDRQTDRMNESTFYEDSGVHLSSPGPQGADSNDATFTHIFQIYAKHVSPGYQFIGMFRATKQKIVYS